MTRKHLEWSDIRPTLLRAVGRSGVEWQLHQRDETWVLYRYAPGADPVRVSSGWIADMKSLAELEEADLIGPAPAPQRIEWARINTGRHHGTAACGLVYHLLKAGDVWQLACMSDGDFGGFRDEGSLPAMKAAAQRHATEAAKPTPAEATG